MKLFTSAAVLLVAGLWARSDEKKEAPQQGDAAYGGLAEPWRKKLSESWSIEKDRLERLAGDAERAIKPIEDKLATAKRSSDLNGTIKAKRAAQERIEKIKSELSAAQTLLMKAKADVAKILKNDPPFIPAIGAPLNEWEEGDWGTSDLPVRIFQVLPPNNVLITNRSGIIVMLKVSSTKGLVDDKTFAFPDGAIINVTGTTTYKTALGGTNTVTVAELLSLQTLKR